MDLARGPRGLVLMGQRRGCVQEKQCFFGTVSVGHGDFRREERCHVALPGVVEETARRSERGCGRADLEVSLPSRRSRGLTISVIVSSSRDGVLPA